MAGSPDTHSLQIDAAAASTVTALTAGNVSGRTVIVSGSVDGIIERWLAASGTRIGRPIAGERNRVLSVAVSEIAGRAVIVSLNDRGKVEIWDLHSGARIRHPLARNRPSVASILALDGPSAGLATGGVDGSVTHWTGADLSVRHVLNRHVGAVLSMAAAMIGEDLSLVTLGSDGVVQVSSLGERRRKSPAHVFRAPAARLIATSPDGRTLLAVSGDDAAASLWDPTTGTATGSLLLPGASLRALAMMQLEERSVVVTAGDDQVVRIWDANSQTESFPVNPEVTGPVRCLVPATIDGRRVIVVGGDDGSVRIIDYESGQLIGTHLSRATGKVRAAAAITTAHGLVVVAMGARGCLQIWSGSSGRYLGTLWTGLTEPFQMAIDPASADGDLVVITCSPDGTVRGWNAASNDLIREFKLKPAGVIQQIATTSISGSAVLVTYDSGGAIDIWRLWDGDHRGAIAIGLSVEAILATSVDGKPCLAVVGRDRTVSIWNLISGEMIGERRAGLIATPQSRAAFTLEDKPVIATGGPRGRVTLWSPLSGKTIDLLIGGRAQAVWALAATSLYGDPVIVAGLRTALVVTRLSDIAPGETPTRLWADTSGVATDEPSDRGHVGPPIPRGLTEALTSGQALLVTGPDIPVLRSLPGRREFLRSLITFSGPINDTSERVLHLLEQGDVEPAAILLRNGSSPVEQEMALLYSNWTGIGSYRELADLPFSSVISLSGDPALLEAFAARLPMVVNSQSFSVLSAARSGNFTFAWVAGGPEDEKHAISERELWMRLRIDETLSRFLTGLVESQPLIFVGGTASDLAGFLDALPLETSNRAPRFALCPIDQLWEVSQARMVRAGVELIGYEPNDPAALPSLIERISKNIGIVRPPGKAAKRGTPDTSRLTHVTLTNIGVFEELDLELTPGWNVVLGNNGCGKSTLLQAVALGLCGDDPSVADAGKRLLRVGCEAGEIILQIGTSRHRTELRRAGNSVRVRTSSLTPLQKGEWVVLGFPAVRGMSLQSQTAPTITKSAEPQVEDLLPLLRSEADHRLDDVKQWIVNLEAAATVGHRKRIDRLLPEFFGILRELVPATTFEYGGVDPHSFEINVQTATGTVPIDQLSQGMSSVIAWVGTLLLRMYDIFDDDANPSGREAFVLIDELDAHLHPEWQRLIPDLARKHFPRVQFLATSHSPLVAGSLRRGEIFVASQGFVEMPDGPEHVVSSISPIDIDPKGLRADQILTSAAFSLLTTRSPQFDHDARRYDTLFMTPSRSRKEQDELERLRDEISAAYRDGETVEERRTEAREEEALDETLFGIPSREEREMRRRRLEELSLEHEEPLE